MPETSRPQPSTHAPDQPVANGPQTGQQAPADGEAGNSTPGPADQRALRLLSLVSTRKGVPPEKAVWRDHVKQILIKDGIDYQPPGQRIKICHATHLAKEMLLCAGSDSTVPGYSLESLAEHIEVSDRTTGSSMRTLKNAGLIKVIKGNDGKKAYVLMVGKYPLSVVYAASRKVAGINHEKGIRWKRVEPDGRDRIFENIQEFMPTETIAEEFLTARRRRRRRRKVETPMVDEAMAAAATGTDDIAPVAATATATTTAGEADETPAPAPTSATVTAGAGRTLGPATAAEANKQGSKLSRKVATDALRTIREHRTEMRQAAAKGAGSDKIAAKAPDPKKTEAQSAPTQPPAAADGASAQATATPTPTPITECTASLAATTTTATSATAAPAGVPAREAIQAPPVPDRNDETAAMPPHLPGETERQYEQRVIRDLLAARRARLANEKTGSPADETTQDEPGRQPRDDGQNAAATGSDPHDSADRAPESTAEEPASDDRAVASSKADRNTAGPAAGTGDTNRIDDPPDPAATAECPGGHTWGWTGKPETDKCPTCRTRPIEIRDHSGEHTVEMMPSGAKRCRECRLIGANPSRACTGPKPVRVRYRQPRWLREANARIKARDAKARTTGSKNRNKTESTEKTSGPQSPGGARDSRGRTPGGGRASSSSSGASAGPS